MCKGKSTQTLPERGRDCSMHYQVLKRQVGGVVQSK